MLVLLPVPTRQERLGGSARLDWGLMLQYTHTNVHLAAEMHDGTDDDASPGMWPAMRRSPGQTLMASSPGLHPQGLCPGLGDMGALPSTR